MSLEDIVTMEEKVRIEEGMRRSKITAVRIDQISRVLFPLSFASYTFGYWLTYSWSRNFGALPASEKNTVMFKEWGVMIISKYQPKAEYGAHDFIELELSK